MNNFSVYTDKVQSNLAYEVFTYPGGEMQVRLSEQSIINNINNGSDVTIRGRVKNPIQMVELGLLLNAIRLVDTPVYTYITVELAYLPYARADRKFTTSDCFGLKFLMIYLSGCGANKITTLDVHSPKITYGLCDLYGCELENLSPKQYIESSIVDVSLLTNKKDVTILFPDKGACYRYGSMLGEYIGSNNSKINLHFVTAEKVRDITTGKLLSFKVNDEIDPNIPVLIVDDICDGGGTFLGIFEALYNKYKNVPMFLYTTHGIYSKGVNILLEKFIKLYTTDSFYETELENNVFVHTHFVNFD